MLVLSRKQGETIVIGDNIKVTVVKIQGDKVRLGIEAPSEVGVLRSELVVDAGSIESQQIIKAEGEQPQRAVPKALAS